MNPRNPWAHANQSGRDYITPEDVGDAIKAGASRLAIATCVLNAINDRKAEDYRLCAFVAVQGSEWKRRDACRSPRAKDQSK